MSEEFKCLRCRGVIGGAIYKVSLQHVRAYCSAGCMHDDLQQQRIIKQSSEAHSVGFLRWLEIIDRPRRKRIRLARQAAIRRGAYKAEKIDREQVFFRDNWTCQICTKPIDGSLRFPHSMSATIDHEIAIANGGSHTLSNVRAAHLGCNARKGREFDMVATRPGLKTTSAE